VNDNGGGGYTGVVESTVAAPYTGAEGYSGVVYSTIESGFTGVAAGPGQVGPAAQAPVTRAPRRAGPGVTPSPYDQAVMTGGSAPASNTATSYAPAPPDLSDQDLEALADAGDSAAESGTTTPQGTDTNADLIDQLVEDYVNVQRQVQLSPMPEPSRAVQEARRLLQGPPGQPLAELPSLQSLIGNGADWMQNQAAQAIASARPATLGDAYLQGIMQELASAMISTGANAVSSSVDPVGATIQTARQLIGSISDHMSQGEGFWEAVNSTLNPVVQVLERAYDANQIAGQALAAYQAGNWDEAVRLARLAGRNALQSSSAVVDTVGTATGLAEAGQRVAAKVRNWRQRPPGQLPAPPHLPPMPEPEPLPGARQPVPGMEPSPRSEVDGVPAAGGPRSDGITGTVVHGEGGPPAPVLAPPATAYPTFPQVEVPSPARLRADLGELQALYKSQQASAASQLAALPQSERLDPQVRNPMASAAINTKQKMTTIYNQLAHPDLAYLNQVSLDVVTNTGEVIRGADVPGVGTGRIPDAVALYPDGSWDPLEYKSEESLRNAYPAGPNVTVQAFKQSTPLGDQLARQQKIIDYAKSNGYQLQLRGTPLGGGPRVDVVVSPAAARGGQVIPYYQIPN
jgi:hypothetical protein